MVVKLTVDVRQLRDIVSVGAKFVVSRKDDGSALLRMAATKAGDMEVTAIGPEKQVLVQNTACKCSGVFECLVSPKRMAAILQSIETETVELSIGKADHLTVVAGSSRFTLKTEAFDSFPAIDATVPEHTNVTISIAELYRSLSRTLAVCDKDSTRYALGAVLIDVGATVTFVATDSRRLVYSPRKNVTGSNDPFKFLLPQAIGKNLLDLLRRSDMEDNIRMQLSPRRAAFLGQTFTLATAAVEGRFPHWPPMVENANCELVLEGPCGAMRHAGRLSAVMTDAETKGLKIDISDSGMITGNATVANVGESQVMILAETRRFEFKTEFDSGYFVSVFDGLQDSDVVEWRQETGEDPAFFHLPDEMIHILMPLAKDR